MKTSANPKHPTVQFIDGKWQVSKAVHVKWGLYAFNIPKDYRCDLGSVPWMFHWIVEPTGRGNLGFLAHDYAYDDDTPDINDKAGIKMDREEADRMMFDLLKYSGLANWRAMVAWRGVRRGGWLSWKAED